MASLNGWRIESKLDCCSAFFFLRFSIIFSSNCFLVTHSFFSLALSTIDFLVSSIIFSNSCLIGLESSISLFFTSITDFTLSIISIPSLNFLCLSIKIFLYSEYFPK